MCTLPESVTPSSYSKYVDSLIPARAPSLVAVDSLGTSFLAICPNPGRQWSLLRVGRISVATRRCLLGLLEPTGGYCDVSKCMVTCYYLDRHRVLKLLATPR